MAAKKKLFLGVCCYSGCLLTMLLALVGPGDWVLAVALFIPANVAFAGANVFYNAFLPEISDKEHMGRVSGFGWAIGYIGGGLCLLLNMVMIQKPELFGITTEGHWPVRIAVLVSGVWWAVFALPMLLMVPEKAVPKEKTPQSNYLTMGFKTLIGTFAKVKKFSQLARFLGSYLIYNDGVETVIALAAVFAAQELGMPQGEVIMCFLMIQGVAFFGALGFGFLADKLESKTTILITLFVFCGVIIWGYFMKTTTEFWYLGAIVGLVMGGVQSSSRTMLGRFTPPEHSAEFFGFFAMSGKFASVLGPFVYAITSQTLGPRKGILSILIFFIIGIILFLTVNEKKGIEESKTRIEVA
jgi:MFS transporter, UMF1 family